jgi:glycosyltransferase involved in cell wall biosynthesis
MRIAIFNWRDIKNPKAGGAEIVTHEYARGWTKAGHRVVVICPAFPNSPKKETIGGVEYRRLGIRTSGNYLLIHILAFFYYQRCLKGKIDLVVDQIHGIPFFTPLYIKEKKLAFICEVADRIWFDMYPFVIAWVGKAIENAYFQLYKNTRFLTISKSTRDDLIRKGIKTPNITVIYPGIKMKNSKIYPKGKIPTLIYLNRICRMKNLKDAIIAYKYVSEKMGNARFWIVGQVSDRKYYLECRKLVSDLNLRGVKFFGYVSEAQKIELLSKAHVLVHTSVKEGWGMNILEANSCGTPSVGYNVHGLRETIKDGITGLITEKNNPKELAEITYNLLKDKSKYKDMIDQGKKWAGSFSWEKAVKKSLNHIKTLQTL